VGEIRNRGRKSVEESRQTPVDANAGEWKREECGREETRVEESGSERTPVDASGREYMGVDASERRELLTQPLHSDGIAQSYAP
jgi:hypothetical protein